MGNIGRWIFRFILASGTYHNQEELCLSTPSNEPGINPTTQNSAQLLLTKVTDSAVINSLIQSLSTAKQLRRSMDALKDVQGGVTEPTHDKDVNPVQPELTDLQPIFETSEKKRKLSDGVGVTNKSKIQPHGDSVRCTHFLVDKKRFCRMQKLASYEFCAEHMNITEAIQLENGRKRIPCPLDPRHTCFEDLLKKHLKKCNAREKINTPEYICLDVNMHDTVSKLKMERYEINSVNWDSHNIRKLESVDDSEFSDVIRNVIGLRSEKVYDVPDCYGIHPVVARELVRSDIGVDAAKHMAQAGSILNILKTEGLLTNNTCFIEFGSGRGALTFYIANAVLEKGLTDCSFVLVDKTSPRHKRDNKLKESGLSISRIRADIKDLLIGELPDVKSPLTKNVVGIAKHLCGGATDVTIKSLFDKSSNTLVEKVSGAVIATCCHHRCDLSTYVGMDFFSNKKLELGHLPMLTQMAAWGTNGDVISEFTKNRTLKDVHLKFFDELARSLYPHLFLRHSIGQFIKEIIDAGRVAFIQQSNDKKFFAELVNFIDPLTTLENRAIVASRSRSEHESKLAEKEAALKQRCIQFVEAKKAVGVPSLTV